MKRNATAVWNGSLKDGNGKLSTQTGTLKDTQYSFVSRFENGTGTNPEELIAAAHAGCFAMALSMVLGEAGYTPDTLEATATITMEPDKLQLTSSHLQLTAKVPGIEQKQFEECAEKAKTICPISKVLQLDISLETSLS